MIASYGQSIYLSANTLLIVIVQQQTLTFTVPINKKKQKKQIL